MNTATGSLPASIFTGRGVATLTFTSSQLVPDAFNVPRGGGTYFTVYPDKNAAAMIEWAWGVSRLIDGLYKTADTNKIDLKRIAVTGCSYQGKMALYAGAFDERIALTIPEESGGGGEASWRFMATQTGTEDLEAAQGTAWYAQNLLQFKNKDAPKLPIDMHELVAMVAPRAILAIENTGIDRLGSQAGSVSMKAATEVYKALGHSRPDRLHPGAGLGALLVPEQPDRGRAGLRRQVPRRHGEREHEHREELVQHRPHQVDHLDDADAAVSRSGR